MSLGDLKLFRLMDGKLNYLQQRQVVLAQNIANADTPRYKAEDLAPFDFKSVLAGTPRGALAATSASHLEASGAAAGPGGRPQHDRRPYETQPNGNAVVMEDQMMKMADTGYDHSLVLELYQKQMRMLKTAIGRNGS